VNHPIVSRPLQARFLAIPQSPLCYWLRERFFELLARRTLGTGLGLQRKGGVRRK